jgi:uncharacterized circularly permuted ATP-grasp superfamily protein/uncharacterized alpha-E superfamily protein
VKLSNDNFFSPLAVQDALSGQLAAYPPAEGHYSELHAPRTPHLGATIPPAEHWRHFFSHPEARSHAGLDVRYTSVHQQIRDNGVTYNVYADAEGAQRPWSLDLFPLIISSKDWKSIESGILQRVQLLEAIMADCYGPQHFLQNGLLPPALVFGNPGFLRCLHGVQPVGGVYLHVVAFDLARGPNGQWWVLEQRCQAPSGLGYLLENRLAIARQFAPAFESLKVQRLASTYRALIESLQQHSPAGKNAHIALLTPGPFNETYFEHAYLARYLGISLVEGRDLVVRDQHVYLKTMRGLMPVHALLKRVDDSYLDPLELRPDSTLGIPGLLQAIRAGNVLMANAPGTGFLESPALMGFLPGLAQHVLQRDLLLPTMPSWWCGERSAMEAVLPKLEQCSIKATSPHAPVQANGEPIQGRALSKAELDQLRAQIRQHGERYTVQTHIPLSQLPVWQVGTGAEAGRMVPRSCMLRVFAVSDGSGADGQARWRILPGGLARLASSAQADMTSMQRGGSSADVWALTEDKVDQTSLLFAKLTPQDIMQRQRIVTSRSAENLFWLGRYTERTENTARLARLTLECLHGETPYSQDLLQWLSGMALYCGLIPYPSSNLQERVLFQKAMLERLACQQPAIGVGFNLMALKNTAAQVRDRLSQEHWSLIIHTEQAFNQRCRPDLPNPEQAVDEALRALQRLSERMAAITGAQTDRMTRDDGWRLLSIGRHIERLTFFSHALSSGLASGALQSQPGFDAMLNLFDSIITFRAQFQQSRDVAALVDLLVLDTDNPRSLAWVLDKLRSRLDKIAPDFAPELPNMGACSLTSLIDAADASLPSPLLRQQLQSIHQAAAALSDALSARYFTHVQMNKVGVGTG